VVRAWWHNVLGGFERELALLGHADEYDTFSILKARSILSRYSILALTALKLNDGHELPLSE
jgi:hypothetical protein